MKNKDLNYQIINKLNREVGIYIDSLVTFQMDLENINHKPASINEFFRMFNRKKDWLREMLNQFELFYELSDSKNLTS